mgnify:CR=1 FL=1
MAIPAKDGYTIASATPYSNSGSESTQTNVITFVNAVSGAKKAFYKNTSSSAISNRLMVDIIYVKSNYATTQNPTNNPRLTALKVTVILPSRC